MYAVCTVYKQVLETLENALKVLEFGFGKHAGALIILLVSVVPSVLREQEKNWPCYECNRRFVSSEQLQQHLNMHDDKLNSVTR